MTPQINDRVLYNAGTESAPDLHAAIVVAISDGEGDMVTLAVCDSSGSWRAEYMVPPGHASGTWRWMPPRGRRAYER